MVLQPKTKTVDRGGIMSEWCCCLYFLMVMIFPAFSLLNILYFISSLSRGNLFADSNLTTI